MRNEPTYVGFCEATYREALAGPPFRIVVCNYPGLEETPPPQVVYVGFIYVDAEGNRIPVTRADNDLKRLEAFQAEHPEFTIYSSPACWVEAVSHDDAYKIEALLRKIRPT